ncbi:hypothetical protein MKX01_013720, partial [Papaver californicum]
MVKTAGFGGYLLQIIYQTSAGAAVLTYIVFWCLLVPFPSSDNFKVDLTFGTPKDHGKLNRIMTMFLFSPFLMNTFGSKTTG